ncbi:DUF975 family protein [Lactobacillus panisapium]
MTRAELKAEAKSQLHGNWIWAACVSLVLVIIIATLFGPSINTILKTLNDMNEVMGSSHPESVFNPAIWAGSILSNSGSEFLSGFFMLSMAITFLAFTEGRKFNFWRSIFSVFTDNRFVPELLNYILSYIFQILWTCLLIIPGFIKSYSYALTPYIVSDLVASGHEVHATTGITESRRLMNGHKWELFVLDLSFIGWTILAGLTLGIGLIWLIPYKQTTKANFYRNLAGNQFRQ